MPKRQEQSFYVGARIHNEQFAAAHLYNEHWTMDFPPEAKERKPKDPASYRVRVLYPELFDQAQRIQVELTLCSVEGFHADGTTPLKVADLNEENWEVTKEAVTHEYFQLLLTKKGKFEVYQVAYDWVATADK